MSPKHATQNIKEKTKILAPIAILIIGFGTIITGSFLFFFANNAYKQGKPRQVDAPVSITNTVSEFVEGELLVNFKIGADRESVITRILKNKPSIATPQHNKIFSDVTVSVAVKQKINARHAQVSAETRDKLQGWEKLTFGKNVRTQDLLAVFQTDPDVVSVEFNRIATIMTERVLIPEPDTSGASSLPNDYYLTNGTSTPRTGTWGNTYPDLWGLWRIGAPAAWPNTTGSTDVVVAVSDTGIDYNHEDLAPQVWINSGETGTDVQGRDKRSNGVDDDVNGYVDDFRGYDFTSCQAFFFACLVPKPRDNDPIDGHGHGTHVAGTIGAVTDNTLGVSGINWNVKIMAVQGLNDQGGGTANDLAKTIEYAVDNGADVINMSWGGSGTIPQVLDDALDYAYESGVISVAAAGNSNVYASGFYPAGHEHTLAIAAWCPGNTTIIGYDKTVQCEPAPAGNRATFSNFGPKIEITAPGVFILSLRAGQTDMYCTIHTDMCGDRIVPVCENPNKNTNASNCTNYRYYIASGTSMASPHVAGVVALLRAVAPDVNYNLVKMVLRRSAEDVLTVGRDDLSGYGLLRADQAVALLPTLLADPKPDLVLTESSAKPLGNGRLEVTWSVVNEGIRPAAGISYTVTVGTTVLSSSTIPDLGVGQVHNQQVTIILPSGVTNLSVVTTVSMVGTDPEWFTDNNSLTASLSLLTDGWPFEIPASTSGSIDPALANIDSDPAQEIIVPLGSTVHAFNGDSSEVAGWPMSTGTYLASSSAAIADLNGDGQSEVLLGTKNATLGQPGRIFVWRQSVSNPALWENMPGWPVTIDYNAISPIVVADLDDDGQIEIVAGASRGSLYIWRANGSPYPNWPITGIATSDVQHFGLVVEDLNGDGRDEIVSQFDDGTKTDSGLQIRTLNGQMLPGWTIRVGTASEPGPAIADLDSDGRKDIIANIGTKIYAWSQPSSPGGTWNLIPGWGKGVEMSYSFPPIVADINGDRKPEIIVTPTSRTKLHVLNTNMVELAGWPKTLPALPSNSPAVANLDGRGLPEIVFATGSNSGQVFAWRSDGTPLVGWPQTSPKLGSVAPFIKTIPAIGDIDGDSNTEIVTVENYYAVSVWKVVESSVPMSNINWWPMSRYDLKRTGYFSGTVTSGGGGSGLPIPRTVD